MKSRLFIAAVPGLESRQTLQAAQAQIRQNSAQASLTKPENLHLTLRFIGEVNAGLQAAIIEQLQTIPLDVATDYWGELVGLDQFKRRDGALIYAKLLVSPQMQALVSSIESNLVELGIPAESRPWRAHITLARRVRLKQPLADWGLEKALGIREGFSGIHLFSSHFTPQGMRYIQEYTLFDSAD